MQWHPMAVEIRPLPLDDAGLLPGLGERLIAIGMPLARTTLHLRTLHPELAGRTVAWALGEPVDVLDRQHGVETSAVFAESPVRHVMEGARRDHAPRPHR
jgi:adenylate cyclase